MSYIGNLSTNNGRIGKLGEDIACEYLVSKGHVILERNFRNRVGEIDIVSKFKDTLHIIEVKTSKSFTVRAEENMHAVKVRKVARMGELYAKNRLFCIDFIGVTLKPDESLGKIVYIERLEV